MTRPIFYKLALLLAMLAGANAYAGDGLSRLKAFARNVQVFNRVFPQEKVYLHLDNNGYFIGERMWYKAYVTRTDKDTLEAVSTVLYVDLVGPLGETVLHQRLKIENGTCHGDFPLDALLTSGFYEIRAYTRYNANWKGGGTFSRVVPIFEKPKKEGDYSQKIIKAIYDPALQEDSVKRRKKWKTTYSARKAVPTVRFFPEGGRSVKGLAGRIAFEAAFPDSAEYNTEAAIYNYAGQEVCRTKTLREGRGVFLCTPEDSAMTMRVEYNGNTLHFKLPQPADTGCVMTVNTTAQEVMVQVEASQNIYGKLMGITLMHNGDVAFFDTLRTGKEPFTMSFERGELPAGVSQLTLFDENGRIWAERLIFTPPSNDKGDEERVRVEFADSTSAPYDRKKLLIHGSPQANVSLAVRDADTETSAYGGNVSTYLLLSSELKGYVRNPEYYFEKDDAEHRIAADLLCMVQGWTRYDWKMMSGNAPFEKRQPIEDKLYIDGKLHPRIDFWGSAWMSKKAKRKTKDLANVDLRITLYNDSGLSFKGETVTDSNGYFAFSMPDVKGEWNAQLSTAKDGEERKFVISIDRLFQPPVLEYEYYETTLAKDTAKAMFVFKPDKGRYDRAKDEIRNIDSLLHSKKGDKLPKMGKHLGEAVARAKAETPWAYQLDTIRKMSQAHFDMQREADKYADAGKAPPTLADWFLSHKTYRDAFVKQNRGIGWFAPFDINTPIKFRTAFKTKAVYSLRDCPSKSYLADMKDLPAGQRRLLMEMGQSYVKKDITYCLPNSAFNYSESEDIPQYTNKKDDKGVLQKSESKDPDSWENKTANDPTTINSEIDEKKDDITEVFPGGIDELKEVYVSMDTNITMYMHKYETEFLMQFKPMHVFYFYVWPRIKSPKSVRRTVFDGYNEPTEFQMNDYSQMPQMPDFRRTLYWCPDITTDESGNATVEFYNNSTCRKINVSVEGMTKNAVPIIGERLRQPQRQ